MHYKMKYRPDIDGLRAVAVLAVLFYHAGFNFSSGGFVGVDVFFVISGFLITKKISENILAKEFTFIGFYERRIRRIFPALFTTILFTLVIGVWLYDAVTYKELGQSATATTLFTSNTFFWNLAGYFDSPSALKPLLHMWSLSVEEQFYFALPLVLVFLFRFFKKHVRTILAVIAGISFIAVTYTIGQDPSAGFFLTQGRVWELLLGSLLALTKVGTINNSQRNLLSAGGILMILTSIVIYSDETMFPGASAALPVIGSAMIIFSGIGGESLISRVLSTKPFVLIGKISYSLYLWHWPLLVFARLYLIREITALDLIIWFGITFLVSFLSWKLIETPFRSLSFLTKPRIFYLAGSVMALTAITGVIIQNTKGLPGRFDPEQNTIIGKETWHSEATLWLDCESEGENELVTCPIGAEDRSPVFLFWGDSHADAVASAVNLSATNADAAGYLIWISGCPPLTGIDRTDHINQECSNFSRDVIDFVKDHGEIETVILSSRWTILAEGTRYKTEEGYTVSLTDSENPTSEEITNKALFTTGLNRTVDELLGLDRQVILVSPVPEIGYHVPSAYFVAARTNRDITDIIAPSLAEYRARNEVVLSVMDELAATYTDVQVVDPSHILCVENICQVVIDNQPLYINDDHLSTVGAYLIAEIFDPVFAGMNND